MPVVFYERPVFNRFESIKKGEDVFETKVYMRRWNDIDKETVTDRLATEADKAEHIVAWHAFLRAQEKSAPKPKSAPKKKKAA